MATGGHFTCSLQRNGQVYCWGDNEFQQLGRDGATQTRPVPVNVANISKIGTGESYACALSHEGALQCWGQNTWGQLAHEDLDPQPPMAIGGLPVVQDFALAKGHTCALSHGDLYCWGRNNEGQLGVGDRIERLEPTRVLGIAAVQQVALGIASTCTLSGGVNDENQLAFEGAAELLSPPQAPVVPPAQSLSANWFHACIRTVADTGYCWGANHNGQLGNGTTNPSANGSPVLLVDQVVKMAVGGTHSCALRSDGSFSCWGQNHGGQLGDSSFEDRLIPAIVPRNGNEGFVTVEAGYYHTCAIDRRARLWCWGHNGLGQLGDGSHDNHASPIRPQFDH